MNKKLKYILICALMSAITLTVSAQTRSLPASFHEWLKSPGMRHATVALEIARLPQQQSARPSRDFTTLYQYDSQRLMIPASVMKLVTTATALRLLGADYVMPDTAWIVDTTQQIIPGLEHYNRDWLIEDIGEDYMLGLNNQLPDSGRLLHEVVRDTNVESLNLQAETLLRMLAPECPLDSDLLVVKDYWKQRGLDTEESLIMYDGCGLAPTDRVTPHFIIQLLADMQKDDYFVLSLPEVGKEGTVRRFLLKTRLEGKGRLKTGTLKSTIAYAGYLTGSDSKRYAVSIFVNNYTCKAQVVRKGIEKVLLSLIP